MTGCNCNVGLSNTGLPNCVPIHMVTRKLILVPLKDNDGNRNGIDVSTALPTWSNLVNEADASKRWFPLPEFENVDQPKAESQFEEARSGRKVFLREGKRSFSGELWAEDSSPTLLGKLKANRCVNFGAYSVDTDGSLIGSLEGNMLYPIPVDNASWDPRYVPATDDATSKIMVGFDFDRNFDDSSMYMITSDEAGINFNSLEGLIDVNFATSSITTTGFVATSTLDYGTAVNKLKFKGAQLADFALAEVTPTPATITITSVTEGADGVYTFVIPSQTSGDVLRLTLAKDGYIGSVDITIP